MTDSPGYVPYQPAIGVPSDIKTWRHISLYQQMIKKIDLLIQFYSGDEEIKVRDREVRDAKRALLSTKTSKLIDSEGISKHIKDSSNGIITENFQTSFSCNRRPDKDTVLQYLQGTTKHWYESRLNKVIIQRLQPINPDKIDPETIPREQLTIEYACDLISAEQLALQRSEAAKRKCFRAMKIHKPGEPSG